MGSAAAYRHEGEGPVSEPDLDKWDRDYNDLHGSDDDTEYEPEPPRIVPEAERHYLAAKLWCHPELVPHLVSASLVKPHPRNARNGDVDAIKESMLINGVYRPVYAQRSSGYALAGNHSHLAMVELGAEEVPVIWLDVSDEQALRILIADNRSADLGMYDDGLMVQLLDELNATPVSLLGTGYAEDDLADLRLLLDSPLDLDGVGRDYSPGGSGEDWVLVTVRVTPQQAPIWDRLVDDADGDRSLAMARLLTAADQ